MYALQSSSLFRIFSGRNKKEEQSQEQPHEQPQEQPLEKRPGHDSSLANPHQSNEDAKANVNEDESDKLNVSSLSVFSNPTLERTHVSSTDDDAHLLPKLPAARNNDDYDDVASVISSINMMLDQNQQQQQQNDEGVPEREETAIRNDKIVDLGPVVSSPSSFAPRHLGQVGVRPFSLDAYYCAVGTAAATDVPVVSSPDNRPLRNWHHINNHHHIIIDGDKDEDDDDISLISSICTSTRSIFPTAGQSLSTRTMDIDGDCKDYTLSHSEQPEQPKVESALTRTKQEEQKEPNEQVEGEGDRETTSKIPGGNSAIMAVAPSNVAINMDSDEKLSLSELPTPCSTMTPISPLDEGKNTSESLDAKVGSKTNNRKPEKRAGQMSPMWYFLLCKPCQ